MATTVQGFWWRTLAWVLGINLTIHLMAWWDARRAIREARETAEREAEESLWASVREYHLDKAMAARVRHDDARKELREDVREAVAEVLADTALSEGQGEPDEPTETVPMVGPGPAVAAAMGIPEWSGYGPLPNGREANQANAREYIRSLGRSEIIASGDIPISFIVCPYPTPLHPREIQGEPIHAKVPVVQDLMHFHLLLALAQPEYQKRRAKRPS